MAGNAKCIIGTEQHILKRQNVMTIQTSEAAYGNKKNSRKTMATPSISTSTLIQRMIKKLVITNISRSKSNPTNRNIQ